MFFEYYREVGGIVDDLGEFERLFVDILSKSPMFISNGRPKEVNYNTAITRMFQYYFQKFDL